MNDYLRNELMDGSDDDDGEDYDSWDSEDASEDGGSHSSSGAYHSSSGAYRSGSGAYRSGSGAYRSGSRQNDKIQSGNRSSGKNDGPGCVSLICWGIFLWAVITGFWNLLFH